jgi:4'-phosphopantetheinyl transferase
MPAGEAFDVKAIEELQSLKVRKVRRVGLPPPAAAFEPLPSVELEADEVHVWTVDLDSYVPESLSSVLSKEEVERATRFHFSKDRHHFIVARGLLRELSAAYLKTRANELEFQYGPQGKPTLVVPAPFNFNLAHSHGRAAYAFSANRELGIDLELVRADFGGVDLAQRFFSAREIETLLKVPARLASVAFFNCWTRKEAYIKAIGEGLSMPLNLFDVSLSPGEPAALLRNRRNEDEVSRWSMQSLTAPEGYVAALVVEGNDWKLKTFTLPVG